MSSAGPPPSKPAREPTRNDGLHRPGGRVNPVSAVCAPSPSTSAESGPRNHPTQKTPGETRESPPWVIRTPPPSLDARHTFRRKRLDPATGAFVVTDEPISGREKLMLLHLESYCRDKSYCWVSNPELADAYGRKQSALHAILKEMEDDGLIWRERSEAGRGKTARVGIILLKRFDPGLPVADHGSLETRTNRGLVSSAMVQASVPEVDDGDQPPVCPGLQFGRFAVREG